MKIAYADPPYIGQAKRHYSQEDSYAGEVNHTDLIRMLVAAFPDGWALSCSSPSLPILLPIVTAATKGLHPYRIGAWVKSFCAFKKGVRPAYAWEPVIYWGGRNPPWYPHPPPPRNGKQTTPKDFVVAPITLKKGLVGAKPPAFCEWLFWLMGMRAGDQLIDLFPGTGAVTQAWQELEAKG